MPSSDTANGPAKKILIIGKNGPITEEYKRKFESEGFLVEVEKNGTDGYYSIYQTHPSAVILNNDVPGMDGPAIIGKFRAQRQFANLPFIVLSNTSTGDGANTVVDAGVANVFNMATTSLQEVYAAVLDCLQEKIQPAEIFAPPEVAPLEGESVQIKSNNLLLPSEPFANMPAPPPFVGAPGDASRRVEKDQEPISAVERQADPRGVHCSGDSLETSNCGLPIKKTDMEAKVQHVKAELLEKSDARLSDLREVLNCLPLDENQPSNEQLFLESARIAHSISESAASCGLSFLAQTGAAIEALTWELYSTPSQFKKTTRQTLAKAIDLIARLLDCGYSIRLKEFKPFNVLVVDDHKIARTMISRAFTKVNLANVTVGRPELALELLKENAFDLVILDIIMDGISGFEICAALRKMLHQQHCQVVFVSSLNDLQSRLEATKVGGNDFVAKPFTPMELALKALLHLIMSHLDRELDAPKESPG